LGYDYCNGSDVHCDDPPLQKEGMGMTTALLH
jgi:hypothetical protein